MSPIEPELEMLAVAREAAAAAAAVLIAGQGAPHRVQAKSSPTDPVSETDVAAERAIREVLGRRRPDDAILGEEGGATGDGELRWVIDPLDGTTNFLYGIPQYAVSVACEDADGAIAGVVLDPVRGEEFSAVRSGPAQLNGADIVGSGHGDLSTALVATGFAYASEVRARQADVLARVLPRVRDVRRAGSAALDLAWCACGRHDAYWERGVKPWDIAAGGLIAARAGLELALLPEAPGDPAGLLAAPPALREELLALVLG